MSPQESPDRYTVHPVPFDEWADTDTLLHRASVTSGEFDYVLRPLCPDCGAELGMEYEEVADGASILTTLVCEPCLALWSLDPASVEE